MNSAMMMTLMKEKMIVLDSFAWGRLVRMIHFLLLWRLSKRCQFLATQQSIARTGLSFTSDFKWSSLSGPILTGGIRRQREQHYASHYHSIQLHFYPGLLAKLIITGQQWSHILPHGKQELRNFSVSLSLCGMSLAWFFSSDSWRSHCCCCGRR